MCKTSKIPFQRHDLFQFIRQTMQVPAMYPLHLERYFARRFHLFGRLLDIAYEMFTFFTTFHIWVLYLCTLYISKDKGDLDFQVDCLIQAIIYFWAISMKIYFRRIRPHLVRDLMDTITKEQRTRSADGFTYVTMDECIAMANKYLKVFVYSCYIGTVFWMTLPITYGDRSLPLQCWYPIDYKLPIIYETLYFLQFMGQVEVATTFASSSGFHMNLAIIISGQFDLLNCSLKNIIATTHIIMGATSDQLMELKHAQRLSDSEPLQYYCSLEQFCDIEQLTELSVDSNLKLCGFLPAFRRAFKDCIEHHRYILRALRKMEKFYSPIWFFKCGEVIGLLCLVAFVSVKSTTVNSSILKTISIGQYLLLVVWEMLIISYFGQIIYLNSLRCGDAILRSPWYLHLHEMKHDFLLFLLNSQRPFKLTAGKISTLNTDQFRSIMTTAFSFLTLLQKMDQRN